MICHGVRFFAGQGFERCDVGVELAPVVLVEIGRIGVRLVVDDVPLAVLEIDDIYDAVFYDAASA